MGDPGLVAGDAVAVAVAHRAGAERAEVGAGAGLGEHGRRQDLAGRQLGQPSLLLRLGAAEADQFGRDLAARAERAEADIAARQLLRHHAHRQLAEAEPAVVLRHGQAEDAELRQRLDHRHRDIGVLPVPLMGIVAMIVGEAAELLADHGQRLVVERRVAEFAVGDRVRRVRISTALPAPLRVRCRHRRIGGEAPRPQPACRDRPAAGSRPGSSAVPPVICARYSPNAAWQISASRSPSRPPSLQPLRPAQRLPQRRRHRS